VASSKREMRVEKQAACAIIGRELLNSLSHQVVLHIPGSKRARRSLCFGSLPTPPRRIHAFLRLRERGSAFISPIIASRLQQKILSHVQNAKKKLKNKNS